MVKDSSTSLTDEDRQQLNMLLGSLENLARHDDNKMAAAMLLVVRGHLKKGEADVAALYLASMLRDINSLNNWYLREVNIDLDELRRRVLDGATGR